MSSVSSARGIILRCQKYQESDLIVTLILTTGERLSLLARGALKSKKRFSGGVLEPSHFVEIQFRRANQEGRLGSLEGGFILEDFAALRKNYERMELALFCVLCVGKVSQEGDPESAGLFNLLGNALRSLAQTDKLDLFKVTFCIKLLFQQGVLDIETWMHPFLKRPFTEIMEAETRFEFSALQMNWLENKVNNYLQTAGTHLD